MLPAGAPAAGVVEAGFAAPPKRLVVGKDKEAAVSVGLAPKSVDWTPGAEVSLGASTGIVGLSVFAAPRLPKLNPPLGALGGSVIAGVAGLVVALPPRLPKLNPPDDAFGGSAVVVVGVAALSAPVPKLAKLKPPVLGASVGVAGLSVFPAPKLPKLKPPEGADGAEDDFETSPV